MINEVSGVDSDTRYRETKPAREKGQMAPNRRRVMQTRNQRRPVGRSGMIALLAGAIPASLHFLYVGQAKREGG